MILTITQAGIDAENAAITSTGIMPVFDKIILGDGQPNPNPYQAITLSHAVYTTEVLIVERLSDGAIKLTTHIPIDVEVDIKEIGLTLSDGTLYAYCPYSPETNGFYKAKGFEFSFYVILSRKELADLTFTYEPISTDELKQRVVEAAKPDIDAYTHQAVDDIEVQKNIAIDELDAYARNMSINPQMFEPAITVLPVHKGGTGTDNFDINELATIPMLEDAIANINLKLTSEQQGIMLLESSSGFVEQQSITTHTLTITGDETLTLKSNVSITLIDLETIDAFISSDITQDTLSATNDVFIDTLTLYGSSVLTINQVLAGQDTHTF